MPDTLALPPELTIYTIGDVNTRLAGFLHNHAAPRTGISIAADAVCEMDAAGLQWLIAFAHTCKSLRKDLMLVQPSHFLEEALAALGLTGFFAPAARTQP